MTTPTTCFRLYADENGESHFEEIPVPLSPVQYAPPAPALELSEPIAATGVVWMRFPSDWEDFAHSSPRRQLFVMLEGAVEGWTSQGDRRVFTPGQCLLMEDTTGKGHGARPLGGDARALVIMLE